MDLYLLELVRYIHLNPVRAGIVRTLPELRLHKYCGHGELLGYKKHAWQDTSEVLGRFGSNEQDARRSYEDFVADGLKAGKRADLTGGGLVRSATGCYSVISE